MHPHYGTPLEAVFADYLTPEMAERQEAVVKRIRERNARFLRLRGDHRVLVTIMGESHVVPCCHPEPTEP